MTPPIQAGRGSLPTRITQADETPPFFTLPTEMILDILKDSDLATIHALQLTCWQFYNLLQDDSLWKTLFKSDFPSCRLPPFPGFRESYAHRHRFHTNFTHGAYTTRVIKVQNQVTFGIAIADGKIIIAGDKHIEILNLATGNLLGYEFGTYISLHVSGNRFFVGLQDGTIDVFDLKTLLLEKTLRGHRSNVTCLGSYGDHLISGSIDNTIRIWDVATGESQSLAGHLGGITSLVVTPEGKLYTRSMDMTIRVWDLNTRKFECILDGHQHGVSSLAFDGEYLISGSFDRTIKVWDLKKCSCLKTLQNDDDIYRLACIEGKMVSSGRYTTNCLWDLERKVKLCTFYGPSRFCDLVFVNDKLFIAAGSEVWIFDFQAKGSEIFREIAGHLKQRENEADAWDRFYRMPKEARKKIKEKLDQTEVRGAHLQLAEAIEFYLAEIEKADEVEQ